MMAITINSLITNLFPGALAGSGQLSVTTPPVLKESGVVFSRAEPWRNQLGSGYTRKDASGQRSTEPTATSSTEQSPGSSKATNALAAESPGTEKIQPAKNSVKKPNGEFMSTSEMTLLRELQKVDQSVKAHEMAHLAAAGGYAKGGASFSYQRGPDGQNYAIGGEVQVDTGKEATPEATIQKMQIVRQAALAPVDPSPQDQRVAAHATLQISESFNEMRLAQTAQAQASATPVASAMDDKETAHGIYQGGGQDLIFGAVADSKSKPKKKYEVYLKPLSPTLRSDRQGLDRMA